MLNKDGEGTPQSKEIRLMVKSTTYIHLVELKTSDFFVETLLTFSMKISINISDCGKSIGSFEVYITCLNRLYFSVNFHDVFLRFSSSKMINL